ncbi:MAG: dihydrolipoyl dehydrogenase [Desulfuromonas sp.]|nr:dihydrolipoyl dehydrogenase [Desulfuromonas sp.]
MAETIYDLLVLGAGPGGYQAAVYAAQQGMTVAVVDERPLPGGVCMNEGCIPSKALLSSSGLFVQSRQGLEEHGIELAAPTLNLARMMTRKQQIVDRLGGGVKFLFQMHHIHHQVGRGSLLPPSLPPPPSTAAGHRVEVVTPQGVLTLTAQRLLLATGSCPRGVPALPVDGQQILHAGHALSLAQVPEHLLVVGAGAIGLEIGSVWQRLGAQVTVVEQLDQIVPFAEPALAGALQQLLEGQGFRFRLETRVEKVVHSGDRLKVQLLDSAAGSQEVVCDQILVAVGRQPNVDNLGLDRVGLTTNDDGRLEVDDDFQTAVAGIYALGDMIGGPMLAHKAGFEAQVFVERLKGHRATIDYHLMPKVIYTHPELAVVGHSGDELTQQGLEFVSSKVPFLINGRAHCYGDADGSVELIAAADSGRLLGVAILGPQASELINQAGALLTLGGNVEDLMRCCQAHPSLGEMFKEVAQQLHLKILRQRRRHGSGKDRL